MTPVTIGDQKFVKDANKGWVDSKTKQPADKGLIRLLDSLVIDEPVMKKLRTKIDKRIEPVSISGQKFVYDVNHGWVDEKTKTPVPPSLQLILSNTVGFGIVGQAGLQQTKVKAKPKSGGGTLINTSNTNINKPLVAMINQLASIDGFLKQRIDNQKIIAKNNLLAIRESQVEAIDQEPQVGVIKPDAEKVSGSSAGLLALGGLVLLTLDPVQEAIKSVIDGVVNAGKFITNVVSSINDGFKFLLGSNATDPTAVDSAPESKPSAPAASTPDAQPVTTVAPSATTNSSGAVPSVATSVAIPSITSSSKPSSSSMPVATGGATTPVSSSSTPMAQSSPQSKPVAFGSDKYFTANASGTGEIPKNNIVALGKYLQGQGIKVSEHPAFGGVGDHTKNSKHYSGNAIDLNIVGGDDSKNPIAAAKFDALKPQLEAAGYRVLWRTKDHYDHMHVSVGGSESYGDSIMGVVSDTVNLGAEKLGELFGMLGSAIIKPGVPRDKEDYSKAITAAALQTNAEVAVTKTPKSSPVPALPTPPNVNKINGGGAQNSATSANKNSVYYYLRRFGFQDLSMPEKALAR
jgi:hypothetical protein